jgi:hypothetical protein
MRILKTLKSMLVAICMMWVLPAHSQVLFFPQVGYALSSVKAKNTDVDYKSRMLPNAGVGAWIPVGDIFIKTGALYQQKGWTSSSVVVNDIDETRQDIDGAMRFHELTVPLQVGYALTGRDAGGFLAIGCSYDFLMRADETLTTRTYKRGTLTGTETTTNHPYIGFLPDNASLKGSDDGTVYNRFIPSVRIDVGLSIRQRYFLNVFWEENVNGLSAQSSGTSVLKLGYIGASLAVMIF